MKNINAVLAFRYSTYEDYLKAYQTEIKAETEHYINWCKENNLKPQFFSSLEAYNKIFNE